MLSFTPDDEQRMIIDAVRRYAEQDLRKVAHEADEASELPAGVVEKGWGLGLLPGNIPESWEFVFVMLHYDESQIDQRGWRVQRVLDLNNVLDSSEDFFQSPPASIVFIRLLSDAVDGKDD